MAELVFRRGFEAEMQSRREISHPRAQAGHGTGKTPRMVGGGGHPCLGLAWSGGTVGKARTDTNTKPHSKRCGEVGLALIQSVVIGSRAFLLLGKSHNGG